MLAMSSFLTVYECRRRVAFRGGNSDVISFSSFRSRRALAAVLVANQMRFTMLLLVAFVACSAQLTPHE